MSVLSWWACTCKEAGSVQQPTLIEAQAAAATRLREHECDTHGAGTPIEAGLAASDHPDQLSAQEGT